MHELVIAPVCLRRISCACAVETHLTEN